MKKTMVFAVAACLAVSAFLTGCGDRMTTNGTEKPVATPSVTQNVPNMLPDVDDGIVTDNDRDVTNNDRNTASDSNIGNSAGRSASGTTGAGSGQGIGVGRGVIGD